MARSKSSALGALQKLRAEQERLAARETDLKAQAARELGDMLVEAGAETLDPAKLRQLIRRACALGIDTANARLSAP